MPPKILIFFFLLSGSTLADTIRVCESCKFQTISDGIHAANPHDTLLVNQGTYLEYDLKVTKPLTLIGKNYPVIDGQSKGEIIQFTADSIHIQGFRIRNVGVSHTKDHAAILLHRVNYFSIVNNILENVFFGMLIEKSHNGLIKNNIVSGERLKEFQSGNGIHGWHCTNLDVSDNHLFGLRDGIYFEFVDDSKVTNNLSENNIRYGLHFMFSNRDDYSGNTFTNNGAGVAVMFSKFINMRSNIFIKNWGTASFGLLLKEIYDADITNNRFEENTIGINVDGSSRVNYLENDFTRNGWAVKITGGCYANIFRHNNFMGNSFDVSYNSKINDNRFEKNYWSEYSGYDLDKDGIGDVPYRPVKLFSYVVNQTPESIILLRSLFVDIVNFSEKVSPVFTPDNLVDEFPKMNRIQP